MKRMLFSALALLLPVLTLSGCGGPVRPDGMPDLVNKQVTVTQDGQPVEGVHLTLYLDGAGKNWPVFGDSDASGKVTFCTQSTDFKGAPAGSYIVTAEKVEVTPSQYDGIETHNMEESIALDAKRRAEYRPSYDLVDPALKSQATTTLKLSVTNDAMDPETLELGPACREMFIPAGSAPEPGIDPESVEVEMSD